MQLLIWKDKHSNLIYEFETGDQKAAAILDILQKRITGGYFSDPEDADHRAKILRDNLERSGDYQEAYSFLTERSNKGYEYEFIYTNSTVRV